MNDKIREIKPQDDDEIEETEYQLDSRFDPEAFVVPPVALDMSDYETTLPDGRTVYPYEGQTVWVQPWVISMDDSVDMYALQKAITDDDDAAAERGKRGLAGALADIVIAWDLTDNFREPIYYPDWADPEEFSRDSRIAAVRALPASLQWHIMSAAQGGETEGNARGGGKRSRSTSSTSRATARATRRGTTDRPRRSR